MEKIDFLAIGDITTDAFIKLKDAKVSEDINHENRRLCVRFGDKVPYESVEVVRAVGNSANAAVSAARLGLNSSLLTYIGNDENGIECIETLKSNNVDTSLVKIENGKPTNYHYVLWYGAERTILIKHTEWSYKFPNLPEVSWIYLSSLADNSLPYHLEIAEYLKSHPDTKLAFQPGTFQMQLGTERLKDIYARTEIFFCNLEEAERILRIETRDILELMKKIRDLGPKIVCISDGPSGAYAYDGTDAWKIPMYPDIAPPISRTGAGDAFSSTFTVAISLGKSVPEALAWGPINSMSVVQGVGAQKGLLPREELEKYLTKAPDYYKAIKIS